MPQNANAVTAAVLRRNANSTHLDREGHQTLRWCINKFQDLETCRCTAVNFCSHAYLKSQLINSDIYSRLCCGLIYIPIAYLYWARPVIGTSTYCAQDTGLVRLPCTKEVPWIHGPPLVHGSRTRRFCDKNSLMASNPLGKLFKSTFSSAAK